MNQEYNFLNKIFEFKQAKNVYQSGRVLSDEINYAMKRQKRDNLMGNTLDRPTLLMKPYQLQETSTAGEQL